MRTDTQRRDAYNSGTAATTVGLKIASRLPGMKSGFAAAAQSLVPIEIATQAILNGTAPPVPTIQYPFYLSFARELWSLGWNGISGDAATADAIVTCTKWTAQNLTKAVLQQIALDVFGITIP